ncbi:MAG: TRAP transporter small permease [Woeseia sp.]|nr:TRAP transporter small permease [Woeseia sp.]NNE60539.1 TRAP transporter small permease [Woeseia sp.]NNL55760.1 TRAP transporter small permease [Woeseia sp.]
MTEGARGLLARLERWGTAAENTALVILLGAMMVLAVTQIAMRIFFSSGFVWAEELLKLMVLWIALIASIAASRNGRHLRIDLLSHFMPERIARLPQTLADIFAAAICAVLAWQSYRYAQVAYEFEDTLLVDVPAWLVYSILPFAMGLMAYRFTVAGINELRLLFWPSTEESRQ